MEEADFQSSDGLAIHYRVERPTGAPKAVVVINHGVNSHSGRYLWTLEQFARSRD